MRFSAMSGFTVYLNMCTGRLIILSQPLFDPDQGEGCKKVNYYYRTGLARPLTHPGERLFTIVNAMYYVKIVIT